MKKLLLSLGLIFTLGTAKIPDHGYVVQTGSAQVFVQEKGTNNNKTLLFIHGSGSWSEIWRDQLDFFSEYGFRVIALDLPPFGFSKSSSQDYSLANQANVILGVIEKLNLKNITIVGHSFGSGPVVKAVVEKPQVFNNLILLSPALGMVSLDKSIEPLISNNLVRENLISLIVINPLLTNTWLKHFSYQKVDPKWSAVFQKPWMPGTAKVWSWWLTTGFLGKANTQEEMKTINLPTLLIWGDKDTTTPLSNSNEISRSLKAKLEVLPEVGHIPQLEASGKVNEIILKFLTK